MGIDEARGVDLHGVVAVTLEGQAVGAFHREAN